MTGGAVSGCLRPSHGQDSMFADSTSGHRYFEVNINENTDSKRKDHLTCRILPTERSNTVREPRIHKHIIRNYEIKKIVETDETTSLNDVEDIKKVFIPSNVKTFEKFYIHPSSKAKLNQAEIVSQDNDIDSAENNNGAAHGKTTTLNNKNKCKQISFKNHSEINENEKALFHNKTGNTNNNGDKPTHQNSSDIAMVKDALRPISHDSEIKDLSDWRRPCGCLRTSEKLKELLKRFPPPPAPPSTPCPYESTACISAYCSTDDLVPRHDFDAKTKDQLNYKKTFSKTLWRLSNLLLNLLQLSVTTTALALYYIVYFYMQLVYYTLLSAMFFHNADGPMKITIGVVTVTSLIVGFNLLLRLQRLVGITINE